MQVTEVRIKLMEGSEDRLRAFCSITLDHSFVIRDLKVIDGASGPFVAMPSRKLSGHCYRCNYKNHLRAAYCNQCGTKLKIMVAVDSPQKLYADVAHPVNSECREMISAAVLAEFEEELARAAQPGYRSRYDEDFEAISESHDDLFPGVTGNQRFSGREPQSDVGIGNVRIDTSHDSPRRPPVAPSRSFDRPAKPPELPPATQFSAGSDSPSSSLPAQRGRDPSAGGETGENARQERGYRVDSSSTQLPSSSPPPQSSHPEPQEGRLRGNRPADSQAPQSEGGFGAGIFD